MSQKIELKSAPRQKSAVIPPEVAQAILAGIGEKVELGDISKIRNLGLNAVPDGSFRLVTASDE